MDLKYLLLGGAALLVGFLFYPRGEDMKAVEGQFVTPVRRLENEPLHYTDILRTNPLFTTYDLGYVYKVDSVDIRFDDPNESGPKQYELLVHTDRAKHPFTRAFSYTSPSREYTYTIQSFSIPVDARWVQVVINDWFSNQPSLKADEFRVGVRYRNQSPILSIRANYNDSAALRQLIDLIPLEGSKWHGARRIERTVETDGKKETQIVYEPPTGAIEVTADLGSNAKIYGVRLTADESEHSVKRCRISISSDGQKYQEVLLLALSQDAILTIEGRFEAPVSGRYVRLRINPGDWQGDYPILREFEIFTDTYRQSPPIDEQLSDHNAVLMQYENLGEANNTFAPHLVDGFAFDRGDTDEQNRYLLPEGGEEDKVDAGHTPSERSFAYHYDTVKIRYTGFDPTLLYWVKVTYLQRRNEHRIQNLDVDGFILHDAMAIPKGRAESYTWAIPREVYADEQIELNFNRLAGPNAAVSEVFIYEARPKGANEGVSQEYKTIGRSIRVSSHPDAANRVVVDGVIDEWPPLYPMHPKGYETVDNPPVVLYTQWNDDNFYIAANINRDAPTPELEPIEGQSGDEALHLFIDTSLNRSPGMYTPSDHHFVFTISNLNRDKPTVRPSQLHHHLDAIPKNILNHDEIETQAAKTETGYTLEARIPKVLALHEWYPTLMGGSMTRRIIGKSIGLNYVMTNLKLSNNRSGQFAYVGGRARSRLDDLNAPPNRWGEVELVDAISGRVAFITPQSPQPLAVFNAADVLTLSVWDAERNRDRHQSEMVEATLQNESTGESLTVVLRESKGWVTQPLPPMDDAPNNTETPPPSERKFHTLATNSSHFIAQVSTAYRKSDGKNPLEEQNPFAAKEESSPPQTPILLVRGAERVTLTYIDPYYSTTLHDYSVKTTVTVNTGATGMIGIIDASDAPLEQILLGESIHIWVQDADLPQPPDEPVLESPPLSFAAEANVIVPTTKEVERVQLTYQPGENRYVGSIPTAYGKTPNPNDGVLQAVGTQEIWALYLDKIQQSGETNVPMGAKMTVQTGETAYIEFSQTPDLIAFDEQIIFKAGDLLTVLLRDPDLNQDDAQQEMVIVDLVGDVLNDREKFTLTETTPASGEFTGNGRTVYAQVALVDNGVIEITGKEIVTVSHLDALQASGATNVTVTAQSHVKSGTDGNLEITRSNLVAMEDFNAGDILFFRLRDDDIIDDTAEIRLVGDQLNDQETVQLSLSPPESLSRLYPVPGVFFGSIKTAYDTERVEADGLLQVTGGELVLAIYTDELRATGERFIEVEQPCLSNIGITGTLKVYNGNHFDPDSDENPEISTFRAGDTLLLEVQDTDLNTTNAIADLFETDSIENTKHDHVRVVMVEVSGSAGIFRSEILTSYGEIPVPNDNVLQVQGGGIVTFIYRDALQETGETQVQVRAELAVETGNKGELAIYSASGKPISGSFIGTGSFNAGETLRIQLTDKDLRRGEVSSLATVYVTIFGNVIGDEVKLTLHRTEPNGSVFIGELQTKRDTTYTLTDNVLQVTDKEVISVEYIDDLIATGATQVSIRAKAVVLSSHVGTLRIVHPNGVKADYDATHELGHFNSGETIYFRLEDLLLSTAVETDTVTVTVTGNRTKDKVEVVLKRHPEAEGVFVASIPTRYSQSPIADGTLEVQGGEEIRAVYIPPFEVAHDFAIADHAYVNKGARGHLVVVRSAGKIVHNFNIGTTLHFRLEDADLNTDPSAVESTTISVFKTQGGAQSAPSAIVTLYESAPDSHIFRGKISTHYGQSDDNKDKTLSMGLVGGETVTAVYEDAVVDTGETHVEISVNCRANLVAWAPYARRPVLIDGYDDKWPLEKVLRTSEDEALLWLQWDKDSLYLLAQIYDDDVAVPDTTKFYEGADALGIHIDLEPTKGEKPTYLQTEGDPTYRRSVGQSIRRRYILWFCPKGGGFHGDQPYVGQWAPERIYNYQATNLKVAVRRKSNYYIIEARIPFFHVLRGFDPIKIKRHNRIGFNFVVYRSNDKAVHWGEGLPNAKSVTPSDLGMLILEAP